MVFKRVHQKDFHTGNYTCSSGMTRASFNSSTFSASDSSWQTTSKMSDDGLLSNVVSVKLCAYFPTVGTNIFGIVILEDSGQCLKRHHHWNANQGSTAAALTKSKRKIKTYFFLVVMSLFAFTHSPLCYFLSLILGTSSPLYPGDVIFAWLLNTLVGVDAMGGKNCPPLVFSQVTHKR